MSAALGAGRIPASRTAARHALPAALPRGRACAVAGRARLARAGPARAAPARPWPVPGDRRGRVASWPPAAATRPLRSPGETTRAALVASIPLLVGVVYAWLAARAAAYTITNRRVVIRMGLAVPLTLNLPFARIDAGLAMTERRDGTGDLALQLAPGSKGLGWFILWPHTRPWHFAQAQPLLRGLPDAARARPDPGPGAGRDGRDVGCSGPADRNCGQ